MPNELIAPSFLFRYSLPLKRARSDWPACVPLGDEYRLLDFTALDAARRFADVGAAWNERGLVFSVCVRGKKHAPWRHANRYEESDGFQAWIDSRDTKNIHRASRFCHHFVFLPGGGGNRLGEPVAEQLLINRARENSNPVRPGVLGVQSQKRVDGYALDCFIPAGALTGFDPGDYSRLGLFYALIDRELGEQTLAYGGDVPFREDPSVWCTAELAG
jgi:hypothetical protein